MVFNEFGEIVKVERKPTTLVEYAQKLAKRTGKSILEIVDDLIDDE